MSEPETPASDHVEIRCPACHMSEDADPAMLAGAPTIVCRNCGETWPALRAGAGRERRAAPAARTASRMTGEAPTADVLEARRQPLVSYSDGIDKAWAAKIEGDIVPEVRQPSRIPAIAGGWAAALLIGCFIAGREPIVAAAPDLAGLYAGIGMPVNLTGLVIENVAAERQSDAPGSGVVVRGRIRNIANSEKAVPPLSARLYDIAGMTAATRSFDAPVEAMAAGATADFVVGFDKAPEGAAEIVVRFRRPGDDLPVLAEAPGTR